MSPTDVRGVINIINTRPTSASCARERTDLPGLEVSHGLRSVWFYLEITWTRWHGEKEDQGGLVYRYVVPPSARGVIDSRYKRSD